MLNRSKNFIGTKGSTLKATIDSVCVLKIRQEVANCNIGGFYIEGLKSDGTKTDVGCDFHFFHYGSEFRDFNIHNCGTGLKLNECWSSIYRDFRIRGCDVGIHFNNWVEPNLSIIDGNVNDNLFIRGVIQDNTTGILFNRQMGFGLQNSFKQIHFERNTTAIHATYYNQQLSMDCISFEANPRCFYSEGIDNAGGMANLTNIMCLVARDSELPFLLEGNSGLFNVSGFISTTIVYPDYNLLKNIIKINNGRSCTLNLNFEFNAEHIKRNFLLYDINCTYISGANILTSSDTKEKQINIGRYGDIYLQGGRGYNKESGSLLTFESNQSDYENGAINSFRLKLGKDPTYALGIPKIQVRKNEIWEDALTIHNGSAQIYGKTIQVVTTMTLDTPYYTEKMKSEGVYNDFISYMDEKTAYDNQQREKEKAIQSVYEDALKGNPSLTYEEFISTRPATFSRRKRSLEIQEPVPSQALLEFKERYLG